MQVSIYCSLARMLGIAEFNFPMPVQNGGLCKLKAEDPLMHELIS